jgi:hypothetical protein
LFSSELLRVLLVSELVKAPTVTPVPAMSIDDIVDETARFLMPDNPEESLEVRIKRYTSGVFRDITVMTPHFA